MTRAWGAAVWNAGGSSLWLAHGIRASCPATLGIGILQLTLAVCCVLIRVPRTP